MENLSPEEILARKTALNEFFNEVVNYVGSTDGRTTILEKLAGVLRTIKDPKDREMFAQTFTQLMGPPHGDAATPGDSESS